MNDNYVKIAFNFFSDLLDEQITETMWAEIRDQSKCLYKLASIPFYAPLVAYGDVVLAEFDEGLGMLLFKEVVEFSGHLTIQVVIMSNAVATNDVREKFAKLGCSSEKMKEGYFVIDVPAEIDYIPVKNELVHLSESDIIDYAEACLSSAHDYEE